MWSLHGRKTEDKRQTQPEALGGSGAENGTDEASQPKRIPSESEWDVHAEQP